jgi:hypothetical protein
MGAWLEGEGGMGRTRQQPGLVLVPGSLPTTRKPKGKCAVRGLQVTTPAAPTPHTIGSRHVRTPFRRPRTGALAAHWPNSPAIARDWSKRGGISGLVSFHGGEMCRGGQTSEDVTRQVRDCWQQPRCCASFVLSDEARGRRDAAACVEEKGRDRRASVVDALGVGV